MVKNYKSEKRRVGFEIEFQNLTPKRTASILAEVTKGRIEKVSDASYLVKSSHGDFKAETDADLVKKLASSSEENLKLKKFNLEGVIQDIIDPITKELVPTEIVSPPLVEDSFYIIAEIEKAIVKNGAKGTNESARFAFASQFNPEIISKDSLYLLNILRAYILMTHWLRSQINIDLTRRITSYVDDFPIEYALIVLQVDYSPNLNKLIDDYLEYNPTRNRGLDFLPLFLFLDKDRVRNVVKDDRVKPRPTFHYRLPSCQIGLDSWDTFVEWKRWCLVEELASNHDFLLRMSESFLKLYQSNTVGKDSAWLKLSNHFMENLRK